MIYTIKDIEDKNMIIFKAICGSHLYGLNTETSDVDYRSVFMLPVLDRCSLNPQDQINDDTNDYVSYEVNRYLELLQTSNPNILELLFATSDKIIINKPEFEPIYRNKDKFLTKQCKITLTGYAITQIRKAKGLNKKINKPLAPERKTPLDFCYIFTPLGTEIITEWFHKQRIGQTNQSSYGLNRANHAQDVYYMYWNKDKYPFKGILNEDETSNELRLSSIPKEIILDYDLLYFNKDGYTQHCRDYKEYQDWLLKRNPSRYQDNVKAGSNYDVKNIMHCMRLLEVGLELAETGELNVVRKDRDFLLGIRQGKYTYDYLINLAEEKISRLDEMFEKSNLPDNVDPVLIEDIQKEIRWNQLLDMKKYLL